MTDSDQYSALSCPPDYQLPEEFHEAVSGLPEQGALRVWSYYAGETFGPMFGIVGPVFFDPDYGTLPLAERKLIATVASAKNGCEACLLAHGHDFGNVIGDHVRARRISINYRAVSMSQRERAIADFAYKLTDAPERQDPTDLVPLREAGLSDSDIYHVVEATALWNFSNRMASGLHMQLDEDFLEAVTPDPE